MRKQDFGESLCTVLSEYVLDSTKFQNAETSNVCDTSDIKMILARSGEPCPTRFSINNR
jgi:hypothetical protein